MFNNAINEFVKECDQLSNKMSVSYSDVAPTFVFSNTGRRGDVKYFSITLTQLIGVLQDILDNHSEFSANSYYIEDTWRGLFSKYIKNEVVNALSTVQSLPLFELINKIISVAGGIESGYEYKKMNLDVDNLKITLDYLKSQLPDNQRYLSGLSTVKIVKNSPSRKGCNVIYYGAPGTGKSHEINQLVKNDLKIVTVFHPDTQYSDFVGSLKPTMSNNVITYQFRAGPFVTALIMAHCNSEKHVYLIIEEINRAPAAAVFGELFQLLDRDDGASRYSINVTDPDMLDYINIKLHEKGVVGIEELSIPANMSIYATMNSSDQAVMPLDTAFKRRWSFRYMKIDFSNKDISSQTFSIMTSQGLYTITWRDFADKVINNKLKDMRIPEDRLIGPFFLSHSELVDQDSANQALYGKLFVYLWDDVLRHKGRNQFFAEQIYTFGDLHARFIEAKNTIFSEYVDELIVSNGTRVDTQGVKIEERQLDE